MSENTPIAQPTNDTKKPARKRTSNAKFTVNDMANALVKKRKKGDTFRTSKEVRGKLRANFDTVCKLDPSIKKVKSAPNDGNRWPTMNAKVYEFVVNGKKN